MFSVGDTVLIVINRIRLVNMYKNMNKGFTLIELLVVIAIIGVLAATVVLSLGDRSGEAREGSVRFGVSAVRSLAATEVASPTGGTPLTGDALCDNIHDNVSADKSGWEWDGSDTCLANEASAPNNGVVEICCHSNGTQWVVWSYLNATDVYCADSGGTVDQITLNTTESSTATDVEDGDATVSPVSCT